MYRKRKIEGWNMKLSYVLKILSVVLLALGIMNLLLYSKLPAWFVAINSSIMLYTTSKIIENLYFLEKR